MGKLHLTPEILRAAYDYLRATPPFHRWKLPPSEAVEVHVTRAPDRRGDCEQVGERHIIRISARHICRSQSLIEAMAHEMVHVHCDRQGVRTHHGREWLRCAKSVCEYHGFDPKLF